MSGRYGSLTHAHGGAAALLAEGWLPFFAAAEALGMTPGELQRAVREGTVRSISIGPRAKLFEVRR